MNSSRASNLLPSAKKQRRPTEQAGGGSGLEKSTAKDDRRQNHSQWLFSRQPSQQRRKLVDPADAPTPSSTAHRSTMVVSGHLGSTSDLVESLTQDMESWSLTRLPKHAEDMTGKYNEGQRRQRQQQAKAAQKALRRALLSPPEAAIMEATPGTIITTTPTTV